MKRDEADSIILKAGLLSVLYYPEIHADDLNYRLADDVAWVLEGVGRIDADDRAVLLDLLSRVVIDPTGNRRALTEFVYGLVEDDE